MKESWCKYFTGGVGSGGKYKTCDAGVNIRELVGGESLGWFKRAPCARVHETDIKCDKYKEPTSEEIAAYKQERDEEVGYAIMAAATILDSTQGRWGKEGTITCPKCGGLIDYSISASNGHKAARCRKEGCISFME